MLVTGLFLAYLLGVLVGSQLPHLIKEINKKK